MLHDIVIENFTIGPNHPPFIIAEMSGNHNHSLERALKIVDQAAACGAHALKIQTYTADTMTIDTAKTDFQINDSNSLWDGESLYQLYQKAYTPWEWHGPIFERARKLGMVAFSTPFDETAVDFLEEHNVPCYKIASFENNHFPLIKRVIKTGKPLIISTGMCRLSDLQDLVSCLESNNCKNYVLLKCTSNYPATPSDSNIRTIPHMSEMLGCHIGLSDHTMGTGVAIASVALGARVIEKHFTLNRSDGGVDSAFSLEPHELKSLVVETERAWQSLGKVNYEPSEKEKKSFQFKRSIYFVKDIKAGEKICKETVRVIRPGFGLHPKYYESIIGKVVDRDCSKGTPVSPSMIHDWENNLC